MMVRLSEYAFYALGNILLGFINRHNNAYLFAHKESFVFSFFENDDRGATP